jgi:hypothetical protein
LADCASAKPTTMRTNKNVENIFIGNYPIAHFPAQIIRPSVMHPFIVKKRIPAMPRRLNQDFLSEVVSTLLIEFESFGHEI